jgi:hypothetical protein
VKLNLVTRTGVFGDPDLDVHSRLLNSHKEKRPLLCTCFSDESVYFGGLNNQVKSGSLSMQWANGATNSPTTMVVAQHDDAVKCIKYTPSLHGGMIVRYMSY